MKIIFEYKGNVFRVVPNLSYKGIEDRNPTTRMLDKYVMDDHVKRYIIADDNHVGGFKNHKDVLELKNKIEHLENNIRFLKISMIYYGELAEKA